MWVAIVKIDESEFIGTLETNPLKINSLKPLTKIKFTSEHIASVIMPYSMKRSVRLLFSSKKFKWSSMKDNEAYF
jgi:hypothetical protein